jgi:hypothetical protein
LHGVFRYAHVFSGTLLVSRYLFQKDPLDYYTNFRIANEIPDLKMTNEDPFYIQFFLVYFTESQIDLRRSSSEKNQKQKRATSIFM